MKMTVSPPAFYWMGFVRYIYNFNYNKNFPKRIYSEKYSANLYCGIGQKKG